MPTHELRQNHRNNLNHKKVMKQLMHRILLTIILVTGCMSAYPSIIIGDLYYELEESAGTATVIGLYNQDVTELTIPDIVTFSDKTFAVTKINIPFHHPLFLF